MRSPPVVLLILLPLLAPTTMAVENCHSIAGTSSLRVLYDDSDQNAPVEVVVANGMGAGVSQRAGQDQTSAHASLPLGLATFDAAQERFTNGQHTSASFSTTVVWVEAGQSNGPSCSNWVFVSSPAGSRIQRAPCGAGVPNLQDTAPFPDWPELP